MLLGLASLNPPTGSLRESICDKEKSRGLVAIALRVAAVHIERERIETRAVVNPIKVHRGTARGAVADKLGRRGHTAARPDNDSQEDEEDD